MTKKGSKKLENISDSVIGVINRMNFIQSVIKNFKDSDDLMLIENSLSAATVDIAYLINDVMLLYDEMEEEE